LARGIRIERIDICGGVVVRNLGGGVTGAIVVIVAVAAVVGVAVAGGVRGVDGVAELRVVPVAGVREAAIERCWSVAP